MIPKVMLRKKRRKQDVYVNIAIVVFSIILGMVVSTELFAYKNNFAPHLGGNIGGFYAPWMIFVWYWTYPKAQYAELFMNAGMSGLSASALIMGLVAFKQILKGKTSTANEMLHGSARWASEEEIKAAGLLKNEGVFVGGWVDPKGHKHYLRHNGSEHLLCLAPTRSGKGICLVMPTLLTWPNSTVVSDLKGELWALTAGWRQKYAHNYCLKFDPADQNSVKWNPMDEIRLGTEYETGDAQNLATMIVDPNGQGLKDHWQKTAQALLVGCILHLLYKRVYDPNVVASLQAVDKMLADPDHPLPKLWDEMIGNTHLANFPHLKRGLNNDTHLVVAQSAQDMKDRPAEEAGSVLSTAKSYLALFRDTVVANNTNTSDFNIKQLMRSDRPVSLYIVTQPADKARLRPLVRIAINMICRILAEKMEFEETKGGGRRGKAKYNYRLLMMLDEFPSMGKLEIVQESLAFLAGYGIRFYIICQDFAQLQNAEIGYGKEEAITSNCHITNCFQPVKLETAEHISKMTGTTTIVKESITESGSKFGSLGNISKTYNEVSRPLMTPDEVMRMPPALKDGDNVVEGGDMLVMIAGVPCIYGKQMPYFLDPVFKKRSSVDPPIRSDKIPKNATQKAEEKKTKTSKWKKFFDKTCSICLKTIGYTLFLGIVLYGIYWIFDTYVFNHMLHDILINFLGRLPAKI